MVRHFHSWDYFYYTVISPRSQTPALLHAAFSRLSVEPIRRWRSVLYVVPNPSNYELVAYAESVLNSMVRATRNRRDVHEGKKSAHIRRNSPATKRNKHGQPLNTYRGRAWRLAGLSLMRRHMKRKQNEKDDDTELLSTGHTVRPAHLRCSYQEVIVSSAIAPGALLIHRQDCYFVLI